MKKILQDSSRQNKCSFSYGRFQSNAWILRKLNLPSVEITEKNGKKTFNFQENFYNSPLYIKKLQSKDKKKMYDYPKYLYYSDNSKVVTV